MVDYVAGSKFALLLDKKDVTQALRVLGTEIRASTRAKILAGGGGRQYGTHVASLPGTAPANLTGALAASIKIRVARLTLTVTDTRKYALALEAGSERYASRAQRRQRRHKKTVAPPADWQIEPRPYLSATLTEMTPEIQDRLDKSFEKIIDKR